MLPQKDKRHLLHFSLKRGEWDTTPVPSPKNEEVTYGSNVKSELRTTVLSDAAERRASTVQKKRRGRIEKQLQKNEDGLQQIRREKIETGKLFLCDVRCPVTNRYCRKEFLSREALRRHQAGGDDKHDFPEGFSTETKLAMIIGRPGGVLACGCLPDRLSHSATVQCFELPVGAPGSADAKCRGKFNRPKKRIHIISQTGCERS